MRPTAFTNGSLAMALATTKIMASIVVACTILFGCSNNGPKPMSVEGYVRADSVLNPDIRGEYRPVNLKIYFLKNNTKFIKGKFPELFQRADAYLGGDVIHIETLQVLPGQTITLKEKIPPGAKYVGVVAGFRVLEEPHWRVIKPVPEKCLTCFGVGLWNPMEIVLQGSTVSLSLTKD